MGLLEFNKLPINTLVGADWKTFNQVTAGRTIDPAYKGKYRLTKAVCRLLSTLKPLQDRRYEKLLADKPLEHDPVFILGHWRSGTTFMHNVFSCDKHFGYNTTYQTVFPHLMMWGQPFFKKNMSVRIAVACVVNVEVCTHSSGNKLRGTVRTDKPYLFLSG